MFTYLYVCLPHNIEGFDWGFRAIFAVVDASKLKTAPYWKLSVSSGGFCVVIKGEGNLHDFVREADKQLYVSKRG